MEPKPSFQERYSGESNSIKGLHTTSGLNDNKPERKRCHEKVGVDDKSCIQIFLSNGSVRTPPYMHFLDQHYHPSVGIILCFTHSAFLLFGSNLENILMDVVNRRVSKIWVEDDPFDADNEESAEDGGITSIEVRNGVPDMDKLIQEFEKGHLQ